MNSLTRQRNHGLANCGYNMLPASSSLRTVRRYAIGRIDPTLNGKARDPLFKKGIDDAMGGLMQVIDGVTGGLSNKNHNVYIDFIARLVSARKNL